MKTNIRFWVLAMVSTGILITGTGGCKKEETRPEMKNVGDLFGGGIIFRRVSYSNWISGDIDYYIYWIAATSDQSQSAPWGCSGTYINCAAVSDGNWEKQMTSTIVDSCHQQGIAAQLCKNLILNGYNDWYLPGAVELAVIHSMKDIIGGFTGGRYWSCEQMDGFTVRCLNFQTGEPNVISKDSHLCVRAIRVVKTE
jgi:hypothetical protein